MSEVILAGSACRTTITEVVQSAVGSTLPSANQWGCESSAPTTKYVSQIVTDGNGKVTISVQNIPGVSGNVTMVPMVDTSTALTNSDVGKVVYGWRCGLQSDGTTVDPKYLPGSCRGNF
ncbi:pilin [Microbulbifer thermotolerans]|nr:pilin [Microbulbifer thermotolerans]MCX2806468.1 pilin [Microbulbifer thermotolerans]MCX2841579.1 pilin [Microbulbifer thermotolerans]